MTREALRAVAEQLDSALRAALPARSVADGVWQARNDAWVPVDALRGLTSLLPCPSRSSVTDKPCLLAWGHEPDNQFRFHRFAALAADAEAGARGGALKLALDRLGFYVSAAEARETVAAEAISEDRAFIRAARLAANEQGAAEAWRAEMDRPDKAHQRLELAAGAAEDGLAAAQQVIYQLAREALAIRDGYAKSNWVMTPLPHEAEVRAALRDAEAGGTGE